MFKLNASKQTNKKKQTKTTTTTKNIHYAAAQEQVIQRDCGDPLSFSLQDLARKLGLESLC